MPLNDEPDFDITEENNQGFTADGRHVMLGHTEDVPMPDGFNAPDNSVTHPIMMGRVPVANGDAD